MSIFDQRGQTVHGNQFNVVGGSDSIAELVARLQSLSAEVSRMPADDETRSDAQHEIQQAIASAGAGNGARTRERLERARQFVETIAGAGNLVSAITDAIHACARIIGG
jgi:hypothetical protein